MSNLGLARGAGSPLASRSGLVESTKRVSQLDAGVLDSELHGLLKTQLGRACSGLPAGTLERFTPEVDALFNLLMFRFTVWMQRPTPGMHLQGFCENTGPIYLPVHITRPPNGHITRRIFLEEEQHRGGRLPTIKDTSVPTREGLQLESYEDRDREEDEGLRYRNEAARAPASAGARNDVVEDHLSSAWGGGGGGDGGRVPQDASGEASATATAGPSWVVPRLGDTPTRTQRLLYALLSIGVQWGFARLRQHGLVNGWAVAEPGSARRVVWNALRRLETLSRLLWVVNLLLFLKNGKYATPVDRIVQMRMVREQADQGQRPINYQFLNRRLLWDHWSKMAYVITPLINWPSIRRAVRRGAGRLRREARALGALAGVVRDRRGSSAVSTGSRPGSSEATRGVASGAGATATATATGTATATACAECGVDPARIPYATECGHVFCYYCARMACTVDPGYACPACGTCFATSRRWCQSR